MATTTDTLAGLRDTRSRVDAATAALAAAREARAAEIRRLRRTTRHTVDELADAAGLSRARVNALVEGVRREGV